ncbi:hypothetical protein ACWKT5_11270 [Streptomyces avermitilis]
MTKQTKVFTADIAERAVRITWPDNDCGGATPPPDGWQDRAWGQEPTLHEIDEGSVSGCSILRWREDRRSDAELIAASLALVTDSPHAALPAAGPQKEDRDVAGLCRLLAAIPKALEAEHAAGCRAFGCRCGCDRAQDCQDCGQCVCWRVECCAQVAIDGARARARKAALRALLDGVGPAMLTEWRETIADAEEAALRCTIARRVRLLLGADSRPYAEAVFSAGDFGRLGMGHADYSTRDVGLYVDGHRDPVKVVDLDDAVLSATLGTLAGLLRADVGADLSVDLTD